jgi:hypothetical protein
MSTGVGAGSDNVELASDEWITLAAQVLRGVVTEARDAIAGQRLCVSEVFVSPPAHLRNGGSNEIAWSFVIADGATYVVRHELEDADYSVRVDYQNAVQGARTRLASTSEAIEARSQARRQAVASGRVKVRGSLDAVTPAMRFVLIELHNRLARCTA